MHESEVVDLKKINLTAGYKSFGWVLVKEYKKFNLWKRTLVGGIVLHECFRKNERPIAD